MKNVYKLISILIVALVSLSQLSCATNHNHDAMDYGELVSCTSPKPEACTREYKPVCGFEADGNHRTFSNACTACASPEVTSFCEHECNKIESHLK